MNRTAERKHRDPNPLSKASIFSRFTFWWLKPLLSTGLKRTLEDDDIYEVPHGMRSDLNTENYAKAWDEELRKKDPSMLRVICKLHGLKVIIIGFIFSVADTIFRVFQPICLGGFVAYFAQNNETNITINDAYWYASGIVLTTAFMIITFHPTILYILRTSCKIRVACSGLMYRKALRLSKLSTEDGLNGKIINIISNDLSKIDYGLSFIHDIWKGPIEAITFFIVIYMEIGISAVIGMAFLASFIPLQAWIGKRSATLRLRTAKRTDFRVKIMNEILLGIQVIKMYAWEKSFAKMVDEIRRKEVNAIRSIAYIRATITSFTMISKISICLSLVSYVYLGSVITARKVFVVSSYFNLLNLSMVYFWPVALTHVAEAYISVQRLQEFLLKDENKACAITSNGTPNKSKMNGEHENGHAWNGASKTTGIQFFSLKNEAIKEHNIISPITDNGTKTTNHTVAALTKTSTTTATIKRHRTVNLNSAEKGIQLESASAAWSLNENSQRGIFDINAVINPGLFAIVGQVGSGKSTLLNVLLGELTLDHGTVTINGSISFACQEPWLFEGTIRDNILFVDEYDEQRYNDVVRVCALERDFKLMPLKDLTIVGERGVSLSGGQRARVNLARAIYKQADIYLLDDPLSAVDAHVGKHIFEKCIRDYLKDKICVLVTHQLQYLKNVQHVILMNEGRIEAQGPFTTLIRINKEALMHSQEDANHEGAETFETRIKKKPSTSSFCEEIENDVNDRKELQTIGAVKFDTYKDYFAAVRSTTKIAIVFVMFILAQIAASGSDYFLKEWVDWEENASKQERNRNSTKRQSTKVNSTSSRSEMLDDREIDEERNNILMFYSVIMVVGTFFYLYRSFSFFNLCLRISINMHDMLFRGITRARMIFFNNNPSGRILNRFARDIGSIDSTLPVVLLDVIDFVLNIIAIMVIIGTVNFWLLIPTAIMSILFYVMRYLYVNTGRSLKRIEALSRSPIYSHMNATLQGLSTVRVFNANRILEMEFHEFQDQNTSSFYLFICATRCFALWLDIVCLAYIAFVTYSFLFLGDAIQSGAVGLAILSSINLVGMCQWGMRQTAELENQMISVERIVEYAKLTPEPPLESDKKYAPPANWPTAGNIAFKELNLRYVESGPRILKGMTFNIESKQKIGIVGRTGAGKSSIIQAIFRLANNEGQILIDGVDIGVIGLHDLRKKISIIPQDPILFSGSLRFNLDPFREKSDIELWSALEQVELKSIVSSLAGGLDCKVSEGGSNFSVGQRQLVCLTRALLRNNKILILDEATANVDPETDKLIQKTIQSKFAKCTVLTIAHRLHTVMENDKVLVMDAGEALEFSHPFELLQKSDSLFKRLVDQTGSSTATALALAAEESYDRMMHTNSS